MITSFFSCLFSCAYVAAQWSSELDRARRLAGGSHLERLALHDASNERRPPGFILAQRAEEVTNDRCSMVREPATQRVREQLLGHGSHALIPHAEQRLAKHLGAAHRG